MADPRIVQNMPAAEYHAVDAISSTQLKDVCKGGLHLWRYRQQHPFEPTPSTILGDIVHLLCLEPDRVDELAVMPEFGGKGSKAARDEWKAEHADKIICTAKQDADAKYMLDSVMSTPAAVQLLNGDHEISMFCDHPETGTKLKARLDVRGNGWITDVKTCQNSGYYKFLWQIRDLHYDVQDTFYTDVAQWCDKNEYRFVFVAVSSTPPFKVGTWELPDFLLDEGREKWHGALQQIETYRETGVLPPNCHTESVELIGVE